MANKINDLYKIQIMMEICYLWLNFIDIFKSWCKLLKMCSI